MSLSLCFSSAPKGPCQPRPHRCPLWSFWSKNRWPCLPGGLIIRAIPCLKRTRQPRPSFPRPRNAFNSARRSGSWCSRKSAAATPGRQLRRDFCQPASSGSPGQKNLCVCVCACFLENTPFWTGFKGRGNLALLKA